MSAIELSSYVGLAALTLLSLNICLGLLISTRYNTVKRWPRKRFNTFKWHNRTGYTALAVAAAHPVTLLASTTAKFHLIDIVYPLNAPKQPLINTVGALALYALVIVVATSYFRLELGRKAWKRIHHTGYAMAALMFVHALLTDPNLKDTPFNPLDAEKLYVEALLLLVLVAVGLRVRYAIRQRGGTAPQGTARPAPAPSAATDLT